jgi:hypothetical protein
MNTPTQTFPAVASLVILVSLICNTLTSGCATRNDPLFVHLLTPRYYTDPPIPPKCIATTQIRVGEDFAVSVGESVMNPVLAGRVEQRGNQFFARLSGRSHTTVNRFEGGIELEKPVESQGGGFSGSIWTVRFVLSTNSDCSVFLKE